MLPVGLANARISTGGYAQKSPRSLYHDAWRCFSRHFLTMYRIICSTSIVYEICIQAYQCPENRALHFVSMGAHLVYMRCPMQSSPWAQNVGLSQEVFGHLESVKILVILNPSGYMLTFSDFAAFMHLRYGILYGFLYVVLLNSRTSTGCFSNSTD